MTSFVFVNDLRSPQYDISVFEACAELPRNPARVLVVRVGVMPHLQSDFTLTRLPDGTIGVEVADGVMGNISMVWQDAAPLPCRLLRKIGEINIRAGRFDKLNSADYDFVAMPDSEAVPFPLEAGRYFVVGIDEAEEDIALLGPFERFGDAITRVSIVAAYIKGRDFTIKSINDAPALRGRFNGLLLSPYEMETCLSLDARPKGRKELIGSLF